MPEAYVRGNTIKYLRVPDEVIDKVKEESHKQQGTELFQKYQDLTVCTAFRVERLVHSTQSFIHAESMARKNGRLEIVYCCLCSVTLTKKSG